ncbi:hypothetical protein HO133_004404 [Letharia lupina]|uniref:N-acetyltransferase domain-containing protein n=1 Tax=Letharia lupina TaxID=560253 RepID=A0A8H6FK83_9LECA|nr:uncharacterized protein HO133_004404 [Letharia lupina]KAF6230065.1 hypothetical protein HO133_004404 [Letharia lupina]
MPPRPLRRLEIEIDRAETSEIVGMYAIFGEAFPFENPKLARVMYAGSDPGPAVEDILKTYLHSEYNRFMIAYDVTQGLVPDPGCEMEGVDEDEGMSYGWISVGLVRDGTSMDSYAAGDLSVCASLKLLATEARDRSEDPRQLIVDKPSFRLALELRTRSKDGQARYITNPHLVVNTLAMWPFSHSDSTWEMAFKLLGWAVEYADRHNWPIWTQIPVGQRPFFHQAGFREVRAFTLNLNDYKPRESRDDWGTQEWVQMVYRAPEERRARSISPRGRGERRRRLSF